jgi:hypothetical protein
MNKKEIEETVKEAERFIKKAKEYLKASSKTHGAGAYIFHAAAPKESGATRRASMDLTRQLAQMRKP